MAGALACASPPTAPVQAARSAASPLETRIVVDEIAAERGTAVMSTWLLYAVYTAQQLDVRGPTAPSVHVEDYAVELAARRAMLAHWREVRDAEAASDPYLDRLAAIDDAGYLDEHVLVTLGRPGWTIPGDVLAGLELDGYAAFARERLAEHREETLARVEIDGAPAQAHGPGERLPDAARIAEDAAPCARIGELRAARSAWANEARALRGVPLAANDAAELADALGRVKESTKHREQGVTWVSRRAADLSYLAGFCEVDEERFEASIPHLEDAVSMSPQDERWPLELVTALALSGRLDDADRTLEQTLRTTSDSCVLGAAWRRKGYVRFERGELRAAAQAYERSLEYDPRSATAIDELSLIASLLTERGDTGADLPVLPRRMPPGPPCMPQ
jgi:tetratricopeptide (TPR) repeat protein